MLDHIVAFIQTLDSTWIYAFLFIIAYLENIIPPIPGDLPVAFVGSLVALGEVSFLGCVLWASAGSVFGFFSMYSIGSVIGTKLYDSNGKPSHDRMATLARKLFPPEKLNDVRVQFSKHGYWLIIANRFLTGMRAIISISAGISHLNRLWVHLCAALSALVWNVLLILGGYLLGRNWRLLGGYITTYGLIFTGVIIIIFGILVYRHFRKKSLAINSPINH
jgi:membrane protein DedA with SNARE-associated domain